MNEEDGKRIAARLAKIIVMMCVRNTGLEEVHAGAVPATHTGDYSDVRVIDAEGREIPWTKISRINDDEMRDLMRQMVNRVYTFHLKCDDGEFRKLVDRWMTVAGKWDEPELDQTFLRMIEAKFE